MTGPYTTTEHTAVRAAAERRYRSDDGTDWRVDVRLPGASNAMVVFLHPRSSQLNRYAWHIWRGPEARSVTARVPADRVADSLTDGDVSRLFRRSMPISADRALRSPDAAA